MHAAIADKREELVELCQRCGVARLGVFGSAARGTDFDPHTSDADFLVEFKLENGRAPLRQYFDLAEALRQILGRSVDLKGFQELRRVLKPGGLLLFTVPLSGKSRTLERARLTEHGIEHFVDPAYHDDPILGPRAALAFRDYGLDILDRLTLAGFSQCRLVRAKDVAGWGFTRSVVVARVESSR